MTAPQITYKLLYNENQDFLLDLTSALFSEEEAKQNLNFQMELPKLSLGWTLSAAFVTGIGIFWLWVAIQLASVSFVSITGNLASPDLITKLGSFFGCVGLLLSGISMYWGMSTLLEVCRTIRFRILTEDGVYRELIAQPQIQSAVVTAVEPYGVNERLIRFHSQDRENPRIENGKFVTASNTELEISDRILVVSHKKFYVVI